MGFRKIENEQMGLRIGCGEDKRILFQHGGNKMRETLAGCLRIRSTIPATLLKVASVQSDAGPPREYFATTWGITQSSFAGGTFDGRP